MASTSLGLPQYVGLCGRKRTKPSPRCGSSTASVWTPECGMPTEPRRPGARALGAPTQPTPRTPSVASKGSLAATVSGVRFGGFVRSVDISGYPALDLCHGVQRIESIRQLQLTLARAHVPEIDQGRMGVLQQRLAHGLAAVNLTCEVHGFTQCE